MKPVYETKCCTDKSWLLLLFLVIGLFVGGFTVLGVLEGKASAARQVKDVEARTAKVAQEAAQIGDELPKPTVRSRDGIALIDDTAKAPPGVKWEYKLVAAPLRGILAEINKAGTEGWELVSVTSDGLPVAYLKRSLHDAAAAPLAPPDGPGTGAPIPLRGRTAPRPTETKPEAK